jgi:hypothetical protein
MKEETGTIRCDLIQERYGKRNQVQERAIFRKKRDSDVRDGWSEGRK